MKSNIVTMTYMIRTVSIMDLVAVKKGTYADDRADDCLENACDCADNGNDPVSNRGEDRTLRYT
jgi:hypothetical protein